MKADKVYLKGIRVCVCVYYIQVKSKEKKGDEYKTGFVSVFLKVKHCLCSVLASEVAFCVQRYLHKFLEVQLGDAGFVLQEGLLGSQQFFISHMLIGGLQGAENKRTHHQVQHDSCQQGKEGGAPHFPPVHPSRVGGQSSEARIWGGSRPGYTRAQLAVNRKFLWRGAVCARRTHMCKPATQVFLES